MSAQKSPPLTHFGFLTLRRFSMIAFATAVEVLRKANDLSGQPLYRWTTYSPDGRPVTASNGFTVAETQCLDERALPDILFVCGGQDIGAAGDDDTLRLLRATARHGMPLGALCSGAHVLAKAGLLDGYRCAVHWEGMSALQELYPQVTVSENLFVIDRDRYTCSGGVAPLDLMLNIIISRVGKELAATISHQLIVDRIRDSSDCQHIPVAARLGPHNPALAEAAALMEANIEEPLSLDELARMTGVSQRQLQRLFRRHTGLTPVQYYLHRRLWRARGLLLNTRLSIMEVTVACGFQSACHFGRSYRHLFGCSPLAERRRGSEPATEPSQARIELHAAADLAPAP